MTMTTTNVKPPLLAYHGDPAVKERYLARVRAHRAADNLIQGQGWSGGKGCAVGCTLEKYDHSRYPIELGVPVELARLEDRIFERLDHETAMGWPERFLAAIRPGADLSQVWPRFALWACELLEKHEPCRAVAALYRRWLAGDNPALSEWRAVSDAAYRRRSEAWRAYDDAVARRRAATARPAAVVAAAVVEAVVAAAVVEAVVEAAVVEAEAVEAEAVEAEAVEAVEAVVEAAVVAEAVEAVEAVVAAAVVEAVEAEVAAAVVEAVEAEAVEAEAAVVAVGYWNRYWTLRREAQRAAWPKCADKLEDLLREAPVRR